MSLSTDNDGQQVFNLLVLFRWLSLIPALAYLIFVPEQSGNYHWIAFAAAVLISAIISIFPSRLNKSLLKNPWLLGFDLLFVAALMAFTGGWRSPYFLYALNPLLAGAFFFQIRGALVATTLFIPLFLSAVLIDRNYFQGSSPDWFFIFIAVIGGYLITAVLGYAAFLLKKLQQTQKHLNLANRNLAVLHDLSTSLQRSANVLEVQDQVLGAISQNLGFRRAILGLLNQEQDKIVLWRVQDKGTQLPEWLGPGSVLLSNGQDPIMEVLRKGEIMRLPRFEDQQGFTTLSRFGIADCLVLPLIWGNHLIGAILVDLSGKENDSTQLNALGAIARQTAVSLGMMMTRDRRARDSATQEERTRIALDLHDSISQSLFGLVYTLEACVKLLPEHPQTVLPELEWALATAEDVRQRIRATINNMWPAELTAQQFEADLRVYAEDVLQATALNITFEIRGDFSTLSPPVRRGIYRICQEGLSNIVQHAAAHESRVCVDVANGRAKFILRDDGRGFDVKTVSAQPFAGDHFGLRGMVERAAALGGTCEIYSKPAEGTSIIIDIPANVQAHHEISSLDLDLDQVPASG
jgi:signal transduction histidine kinase